MIIDILSQVRCLIATAVILLSLPSHADYYGAIPSTPFTAPGASSPGSTSARMGRRLNAVDDFGADPTGSADSTTALQNSFNASCNVPLLVPAGTYKFTTLSVTCNKSRIYGAGPKLTTLVPTSTTGDAITVGSQSAVLSQIEISDFAIIPASGSRTSGANLSLVGLNGSHIHDLFVYYGYDGISITSGTSSQSYADFLDHINISSMTNNGLVIGAGDTTANAPADQFLSDLQINGNGGYGIDLIDATGIHITHVDAAGNGTGLGMIPGSNQLVTVIYLINVLLDTSTNQGMHIQASSTGIVAEITSYGLWAATNGSANSKPGIDIYGTATTAESITLDGVRVNNNGGHGIDIEGGARIRINGDVNENSTIGSASYSGVYVAAGVSDWSFTGNAGIGTHFGSLNQQAYGVYVAAGSSANYQIIADLSGNVTGPIYDGGTGSGKTILTTNGLQTINSSYTFNIGNNYVDQNVWDARLAVTGYSYSAAAEASAGQGIIRMTTGTGQLSDESLLFGIYDANYAWIQANKAGTANRPLVLNPLGGNIAVGGTTASYSLDITGSLRSSGAVIAGGSSPALSGTCSANTQVGGNTAGTFKASASCSSGTVIMTFASTAPNGWACDSSDMTTPADKISETASTTTTATLSGTLASADVVVFKCEAY